MGAVDWSGVDAAIQRAARLTDSLPTHPSVFIYITPHRFQFTVVSVCVDSIY